MPLRSRYTPSDYAATKNEVGVFTTPGYSEDIKPLWRFKTAEEAKKSAEGIWKLFEGYREKNDFVGMDICRKFIQMGRTRSLRYALRPGGKKYDTSTGKEQKRTGKVYDQGKLDGANVYEGWLDKCWGDEAYKKAWEDWKEGKGQEILVDESPSNEGESDGKGDRSEPDQSQGSEVEQESMQETRSKANNRKRTRSSAGQQLPEPAKKAVSTPKKRPKKS
ncbi:hypothetical protein I302_105061 [Kwoniella bestiolae CBS 10118]|uniref:Cytoplasmic protein n=1 Tax=Kwoniella bestiolae CBS 10118 TaxID=1296100 RepID=A0A1B9FQZ5_9TREE|nr:hypothetical protein I302_08865 [Kwoniella bestiolae CBS 10118]OCF21194.1 hypothetical protein I302_08865 [Kwoniella bestiolae CBS 10118]